MATDKRRASRGNTHDPYECCGAEPESPWGRPKGKPCLLCAQLMEDGKALRARAAAERESGRMQPYRFHERDYAAPGYYGLGIPSHSGNDLQDDLRNAVYTLVHAVALPAPATTPNYATSTGKDDWRNPWPHVMSEKEDRYEWQILLLLDPAVRDAIDRLDQVIRQVLPATYLAGKERGRSILQGLATGDLSLADFDDALLTAGERAERERARGRRF